MKNYYFFVLAAIFPLLFIVDILFAQDIHYTQINATPLAVNPAFTGMFDGSLRASAIYRTQWEDVTIPYTTVGASVDIPIYLNKYGNYLAAGVQFMRDAAGDGNLINADGLFSLAYHKFYGLSQYLKRHKGAELGIGVQAGFGNREFDISGLYFNDKLSELPYHFNPGNAYSYFMVNTGICYTRSTGDRFNYTIGLAGYNLNQPTDAITQNTYQSLGLDRSFTGVVNADWEMTDKWTLKPSVFILNKDSKTDVIAGSEVQYLMKTIPEILYGTTSVFMGLWGRTGDIATLTAGIEKHCFRISVGYDYDLSAPAFSSHSNGGFELTLKYVAPAYLFFARGRAIPSGHF